MDELLLELLLFTAAVELDDELLFTAAVLLELLVTPASVLDEDDELELLLLELEPEPVDDELELLMLDELDELDESTSSPHTAIW